MSNPLFDDEDSSGADEEQVSLRVNRKYAREYEERKQREELLNADPIDLGEHNDDGGSSSSESEDEDGELMNDVSFIKTLKAIREKDERIYDSTKMFGEEVVIEKHDPNRKKRKVFKDVVREQVLEQMEEEEQEEKEGSMNKTKKEGTKSHLEYDEEQKDIRKAFLDVDGDHDSDDDDMLVVRKKPRPVEDDPELQKEFEQLEKSTSNAILQDPRGEIKDGERFLMDFLKKKQWKDKDLSDDDTDSDGGKGRLALSNTNNNNNNNNGDNDDDSIDEVDRADDFEARYNFRFEEAESAMQSGADFSVIGYARSGTMTTLRRSEETRKQKRHERKERKASERKAKEEQLRRLKNAKRQELQKKLKEIKQIAGDDEKMDEEAILKLMEGDFDPNKFEELMQKQYDDEFYAKEDSQWKSDVDVRNSLLQDEDGNMVVGDADDEYGGQYDLQDEEDEERYEGGAEEAEEDFFEEEEEEEEVTEIERKLKEKMQDELYKLDYEDIIAGMPTRFKYRKVEPNSYGLSTKEILFAKDTTLKSFVSLKKMAPYREEAEHQVGYKKRRRFRDVLEEELVEMEKTEATNQQNEQGEEKRKKRRRQKKGKKKEGKERTEEAVETDAKERPDDGGEAKKKRRRRKKSKSAESEKKNVTVIGESESLSPRVESVAETVPSESEKKKTKKEKEKQRKSSDGEKKKNRKGGKVTVTGVPTSRLSAYGL